MLNAAARSLGDGGECSQRPGGTSGATRKHVRGSPGTVEDLLIELGMRADITSTESLVEAFNAETNNDKRSALLVWLEGYLNWYKGQPAWILTREQLLEYAQLAGLQPKSMTEKQFASRHFSSISSQVKNSSLENYAFIEATATMLDTIDETIFNKNPTRILQLTLDLLDTMGPFQTLTKNTYEEHKSTLSAIHKALMLSKAISPSFIAENREKGICAELSQKIKDIKTRASYRPLHYKICVIEQSFVHQVGELETSFASLVKEQGQTARLVTLFWCALSSPSMLCHNCKELNKNYETIEHTLFQRRQ